MACLSLALACLISFVQVSWLGVLLFLLVVVGSLFWPLVIGWCLLVVGCWLLDVE